MKRFYVILVILFTVSAGLFSQVLPSLNRSLADKHPNAFNQGSYFKMDSVKNGLVYKDYYSNKKPYSEVEYLISKNKETGKPDTIANGKTRVWYKNGGLKFDLNYENRMFTGIIKSYWENGKLKRKDVYLRDSLISGACFDSTGVEIKHFPFSVMPEFNGGERALMRFLSSRLMYPFNAQRLGIQGRVILQFVVAVDGEISDIRIVRKVNDELDQEAIRVVKSMPRWKPGLIENEPVRVYFTLPIYFKLA